MHLCERKLNHIFQISLRFVPKSSINNKSALVQVMAWHQPGDKPLPEVMMTQISDAIRHHAPGHNELTHWPMGDLDSILKVLSSILFYWLVSSQCCGKSKILGRPTDHPWLMVGWPVSVLGGPSIICWDHEMIKSIKKLVKIRQSVFTLYSDTSTNRHTDGFLQDCSISSALAMEILQSSVKP